MINFKNRLIYVVTKKDSYPSCCVDQAEYFIRLNKLSGESCVKIRKSYRDIWSEFIKRPAGRVAGFDFSRSMNVKFGRERMGEFHSLRLNIKNRIDFLKYDRLCLDTEIRLAESSGSYLLPVLKFMEQVNAGATIDNEDGRWVNVISIKRMTEIMTWKFIQASK